MLPVNFPSFGDAGYHRNNTLITGVSGSRCFKTATIKYTAMGLQNYMSFKQSPDFPDKSADQSLWEVIVT